MENHVLIYIYFSAVLYIIMPWRWNWLGHVVHNKAGFLKSWCRVSAVCTSAIAMLENVYTRDRHGCL